MSAPKFCECGARILIVMHPGRHPKSRDARLGRAKTIPGHDLCGECFGNLIRQSRYTERLYRFALRPGS